MPTRALSVPTKPTQPARIATGPPRKTALRRRLAPQGKECTFYTSPRNRGKRRRQTAWGSPSSFARSAFAARASFARLPIVRTRVRRGPSESTRPPGRGTSEGAGDRGVGSETTGVVVDQHGRDRHQHETRRRDPHAAGDTDEQQRAEPDQEAHGGNLDPSRTMRVEVRPGDLLDEAGVLLREPPLDLLEDPLLVLVQGHRGPPATGRADPSIIGRALPETVVAHALGRGAPPASPPRPRTDARCGRRSARRLPNARCVATRAAPRPPRRGHRPGPRAAGSFGARPGAPRTAPRPSGTGRRRDRSGRPACATA